MDNLILHYQLHSIISGHIFNKILAPVSVLISKNVEISTAIQITTTLEKNYRINAKRGNERIQTLETQIHNQPIK